MFEAVALFFCVRLFYFSLGLFGFFFYSVGRSVGRSVCRPVALVSVKKPTMAEIHTAVSDENLSVCRPTFYVLFLSSGGWAKIKLKLTTLPRIFIHVVCRFNSIAFAIQR